MNECYLPIIEPSAQHFSSLVLSSYMALYHPAIHSKPCIPAEPPFSASWLSLPQDTPRPPPQVCDEECKLIIDLTHREVNLLQEKKTGLGTYLLYKAFQSQIKDLGITHCRGPPNRNLYHPLIRLSLRKESRREPGGLGSNPYRYTSLLI